MLKEKALFDSPKAVREYLQLQLGAKQHEVFAVLFLDSQNRLIALEELFRGTLTQTSVSPANKSPWTDNLNKPYCGHCNDAIPTTSQRKT